jgi:hypothetical protein
VLSGNPTRYPSFGSFHPAPSMTRPGKKKSWQDTTEIRGPGTVGIGGLAAVSRIYPALMPSDIYLIREKGRPTVEPGSGYGSGCSELPAQPGSEVLAACPLYSSRMYVAYIPNIQ